MWLGEAMETAKLSVLHVILSVYFSIKLETSVEHAQGVKAQLFKIFLAKFFLFGLIRTACWLTFTHPKKHHEVY